MRTEIILVRHGQTASNVLGVLHGRTDVALTAAGLRQADCVAERLALLSGVRHLYSSPLRRARMTAEAIGRFLRISPRLRDDLAEINFGDVEGYTLSDLERDFPDLHARILDFDDVDVAFPNGESRRDFHQRVRRVFDDLIGTHRGDKLVVVSHGGVIGSGIAQLTHGDPNDWERFMVQNCSITHVEISDSRDVVLHCWDDISHLDRREEIC
jgi:broad specificity phosphatase PhoE